MNRGERRTRQSKAQRARAGKPPVSKEEFLEQALAVSARDGKLSAAARQNLLANFELQYDYPNEYVVYLDDWTGEGKKRRLERRVLGHGPREDVKRLSDLVASLPREDRARVMFHYIDDPFTDEVRI